MIRLNSEDFSKFFLCLDILVLTYPYESTHSEVQKNAEILSDILEYSWFFRLFRGFSYKTFEPKRTQSCHAHHKIRHKIPRRTVFVRSLGSIGQKWFHRKNCPKMRFYAGWNCVGSLEIKSTHTKKYPKITGQLEHAMRRTFIRIHPRIWRLPTQLRILIEISRIGFPGNLTKIFISRESASLTESETLFGLEKNSTGKKLASRNSA